MSDNSTTPSPELNSIVKTLRENEALWAKVLADEKDTHNRLQRIKALSGNEKAEEISNLESKSANGIHLACLEAVNKLGVKDTMVTIAELTLAIRYSASRDLGI